MITEPAEMWFPNEPTARGDAKAAYVREWYEEARPRWWRFWEWRYLNQWKYASDNLMLGIMQRVREVEQAAARQANEERSKFRSQVGLPPLDEPKP